MSKKSGRLLPLILGANTDEDAIKVLHEILKELYLTSDYTELVAQKELLKEFQSQMREIEERYKKLPFPSEYQDLAELRDSLAFLYRDLSDNTFEIARLRMYWSDDRRAAVKAEAISETKKLHEGITDTGAHNIYGQQPVYQEYLNLYSIAFAAYQELQKLFESIKLLSDSIASKMSQCLIILRQDVK